MATVSSAQEEVTQLVVTVNAVPDGMPLKFGENLVAAEMTNTDQVGDRTIGPYPVFINDGGYYTADGGTCTWSGAAASGVDEWFGLNIRGDPCAAFQHSVTAVTAAAGDGNIVGNNAGGAPAVGTAAGTIPGLMISDIDGARMAETVKAISDPQELRVSVRVLTFIQHEELPPRPPGYKPPPGTGGGFGNFGSFGSGFGEFGFGDFGDEAGAPETEVILIPGPDGDLIEIEIPLYAEEAADETGFNPLIPVTIAVVILGILFGGFFFIRSRRTEEAEGLY